MSKRINKNNIIFMFLFLVIAIIIVLSIPMSTIVTNAQSSSGSTAGGSNSNNSKDQEQKDNTDKQIGMCLVGVGGPCNGDSNWDGRDDRTGQCVVSGGCSGLR
jgi:anionic cell wall polymer biosynthesis LytR-Cps2A-Psr (LCP) family protein